MVEKVVLALDGMGGKHAPEVVVEGASLAWKKATYLNFKIFGDQKQLDPLVTKHLPGDGVCTVVHTDVRIDDHMKPSQAIRSARGSSMAQAIQSVVNKETSGVVSSGNTGAYMALSKVLLKTIPGVSRPAITSYLPNQKGGETVMLDLGANVLCDEENLSQFAVMGAIFSQYVLGIRNPKIGLLNIGEEELKGNLVLRRVYRLLKDLPSLDFYGYVEGDDITRGIVDVVVTDGFTGNVALKTIEGTARLLKYFLKQGFTGSLMGRLGYLCASGALSRVQERMDPSRYNGAMFLGLDGLAIKSHGSTDALGFANAIGVASDMLRHGFKAHIEKAIGDLKVHEVSRLQDSHKDT